MRLLLVHGSLDAYRLSRLIKYSFYKNVAFGFMLFYYQFYCGFSGQAMVDDITAAAFNVLFTSWPILLFAVLDRPVKKLDTLVRACEFLCLSLSLPPSLPPSLSLSLSPFLCLSVPLSPSLPCMCVGVWCVSVCLTERERGGGGTEREGGGGGGGTKGCTERHAPCQRIFLDSWISSNNMALTFWCFTAQFDGQ